MREPCVYVLTNASHTVLYVGVTSDLARRVWQHRMGTAGSFTKRYNVTKLVYYEYFARMDEAIAREKQLKAGKAEKKAALVTGANPGWRDLYEEL